MSSPTPTLRVGAYAVCLRDGAVLLARWIGADPPRWTLPGGGLDHGEDPRDGAVREVEEETGYRVELRQLLTVESFRWLLDRDDGPVDHQAICVIYAAEVVFAFLDYRQLKKAGVQRPFHWAWAFLAAPYVYVIGRSVVVKRVTGGGLLPLWIFLGVVAVSFIIAIGWTAALFSEMMQTFPSSGL